MTYFDEKIKRKLKLRNFKKAFQTTKILKFKLYLNNEEIKIL